MEREGKVKKAVKMLSRWIALTAIVVLMSLLESSFSTFDNVMTIFRQTSMLTIMSVGMLFVLLTGAIDLSVSGILSFVGVFTALAAAKMALPLPAAVFLGLVCSALFGLLNGFIVTKTRIPALIGTLAMQQVILGISYTICGGKPVYGISPSFKQIARAMLFGIIPIPIVITVVVLALGEFLLKKTYLGHYFYAVGSNEEATRLSGIDTDSVRIAAYTMNGFLAGVAGIIMLARVNSGQPKAGSGYEMEVLTAVVVGGVRITGGEGRISSVIVGSLIMGFLSNGMVILGFNEYYQILIKGLVLLFAVGIDSMQRTGAGGRRKKIKSYKA